SRPWKWKKKSIAIYHGIYYKTLAFRPAEHESGHDGVVNMKGVSACGSGRRQHIETSTSDASLLEVVEESKNVGRLASTSKTAYQWTIKVRRDLHSPDFGLVLPENKYLYQNYGKHKSCSSSSSSSFATGGARTTRRRAGSVSSRGGAGNYYADCSSTQSSSVSPTKTKTTTRRISATSLFSSARKAKPPEQGSPAKRFFVAPKSSRRKINAKAPPHEKEQEATTLSNVEKNKPVVCAEFLIHATLSRKSRKVRVWLEENLLLHHHNRGRHDTAEQVASKTTGGGEQGREQTNLGGSGNATAARPDHRNRMDLVVRQLHERQWEDLDTIFVPVHLPRSTHTFQVVYFCGNLHLQRNPLKIRLSKVGKPQQAPATRRRRDMDQEDQNYSADQERSFTTSGGPLFNVFPDVQLV
ncbi:unnamed protein product, partial [Amoebophrya sp. A120]